jgi:4-amino-4-deoxy-L-arabinose transferase-like glycosyltransferase
MNSRLLARFVTVGVLLVSFALALGSAIQQSPTMDEQNHIARGAAYLGTGDPRMSVEHPPLVNVLSALPVHFLLHPTLPLDEWWEAAEWYHFADRFLWFANPDPQRIVFLARLPIIGLGLVLVSLVFRWANARFGARAGLLGAVFCALDPNVLAHMGVSTTDVGGTTFIFLASYALWRALQRPSWSRALWAGLALGLALSAKLSALVFVPIFALVAGLDLLGTRSGGLRRGMGHVGTLVLAGLVGTLVVWAGYGFRLGSLHEGGLVVPAPPYLRGVAAILDFTAGGRPSYLLGQYSDSGWWYYFPVAFAVKTPLATLLGIILAGVVVLWRRTRDDIFLLLPPLAYFLSSMTSSLNIGYRHLLPVLPFAAVHIGRLAAPDVSTIWTGWRRRVLRLVVAALVIWLAVGTLAIHPYFLAYFNPLGGGPDQGWRVLVDSNIDWGQDLKRLHEWMTREGVDHIQFSWFGPAYPEAYGIPYETLPGMPKGLLMWNDPPFDPDNPSPAVYVISVSNLVGLYFPDHDLYRWFLARTPDAKVGYSLFIYEVSADE